MTRHKQLLSHSAKYRQNGWILFLTLPEFRKKHCHHYHGQCHHYRNRCRRQCRRYHPSVNIFGSITKCFGFIFPIVNSGNSVIFGYIFLFVCSLSLSLRLNNKVISSIRSRSFNCAQRWLVKHHRSRLLQIIGYFVIILVCCLFCSFPVLNRLFAMICFFETRNEFMHQQM